MRRAHCLGRPSCLADRRLAGTAFVACCGYVFLVSHTHKYSQTDVRIYTLTLVCVLCMCVCVCVFVYVCVCVCMCMWMWMCMCVCVYVCVCVCACVLCAYSCLCVPSRRKRLCALPSRPCVCVRVCVCVCVSRTQKRCLRRLGPTSSPYSRPLLRGWRAASRVASGLEVRAHKHIRR